MRSRVAAGAIVSALAVIALAVLALSPWPGGSNAGEPLQGDADCNGKIDARDALAVLQFEMGDEPAADCVGEAGDVDCDGDADRDDMLRILLYAGGIALPIPQGCPGIGEPIGSPQPSAGTVTETATPAPTATPTATPAETPTETDGPTATPAANNYHLESVLGTNYLDNANGAVIELALIPGEPNQAIVALQDGRMYRVSLTGTPAPDLWGDVSGLLDTDHGEEGLLSVAFSPDFEQDGRVYLYYTEDGTEQSVLARYSATADELGEGTPIREIAQPQGNHNGGHIVFDHNGYLLLSLGDGGGSDARANAQDLASLKGKVIRIDVSTANGYAIPPDNPFVGEPGADEIFALGFRNPWRMSIDSLTGDAWLGDVGEGTWEEVDHVTAGDNYGWPCREGPDPFPGPACLSQPLTDPRAFYDHTLGVAVTGGFVYRGSEMPELYGWYVYADYYSGRIWAVNTADNSDPALLTDEDVLIGSFTELPNGELLIVSYESGIFQLARD